MYPLDINLNTALDRQADHVRAVEAASTHLPARLAALNPTSWLHTPARGLLAVAVVAPVMMLMAWGLLAR